VAPGHFLLPQGVTCIGVVGALGTDLFELASQGIEQYLQYLVICYRVEADCGRDNGMYGSIHSQVVFAPDTPFLLAMHVNFPFSLAV